MNATPKVLLLTIHLKVLGHELGHNLGMSHDFVDPISEPKKNRYDSKGQLCTGIGALMDYGMAFNRWSPCSVEDMTTYYNNELTSKGSFCLANGMAGKSYRQTIK